MSVSRVSFNNLIVSLYGEVWQNRVKRFARLRTKRDKLECNLEYVEKCREIGVVPKFMRVKPVKCIRDHYKFFETVQNKIMLRVIRDHRRNIAMINSELYSLHLQLSQCLRDDLWNTLDAMTYNRSQMVKSEVKNTHCNKLKRLNKTKEQPVISLNAPDKSDRLVVNLSSCSVSADVISVLAKGLNFAPTPHKMPVESIITGIEDSIARNKIPQRDAECIRQDVSSLVRKSKLPKSNISIREIKALKDLRTNTDLLVLPADKGNATVIVDTSAYTNKLTELVSDTSTYKKVNYNPTSRVTASLDKLLHSLADDELRKRLRPMNPTTPKIYGLPKIHKTDWPLRPIVSQIDSPTYKTARFMANILQPLTGKTASYVKDSTHFVKLLDNVRLLDEEQMVSFDVSSLFTNVPVADTIHIISDLMKEAELPTVYREIIEFCLKSGYFVWQGDYYLQLDGVAMGSPIAPVVANIFMEWFEERALRDTTHKPKHWWRYVDDVFAVVHRDMVVPLLDHLNSVHPRLKFTTEQEKDGSLAFLDVLVIREPSGRVTHTVYRKPTHTDSYLRADSHHHPSHLASVPRTLINRALRLCDPQYIGEELRHVRQVLTSNGYKWRQSMRSGTNTNTRPPSVDRAPLYLPYVKGVTDKIGHLLRRRYSIKTIFRPLTQVRQLVRSPKDKDPLNVPGVYLVPCNCGKSYVGETGRNVATRLTEHIRSLKKRDKKSSAIAEHALESDVIHYIRFDEAKVLAKEKAFGPRKIREAIEISRRPTYNRDTGWHLSTAWKPLLQDGHKSADNTSQRTDTVSSFHTTPIITRSPCTCDQETRSSTCCTLSHPGCPPPPSERAQRAAARAARAAASSAGCDAPSS